MRKLLFGVLLSSCLMASAFADLLSDAQTLLDNGQRAKAMSKTNAHLKLYPKDPDALFLKGFVLQRMGDLDAAKKVYSTLAEDFPEFPEPHNNLAAIYASKGDYESAKLSLLSALKTHPSYSKVYANLGEIYARQASEAYQQALGFDKRKGASSVIRIPSFSKLQHSPATPELAANKVTAPAVLTAAEPKVLVKPVKPIIKLGKEEIAEIKLTMSDWAVAWSSQSTDDYLSYYASFFKPKVGSFTQWKTQRKQRISRPKFIRILLGEMTLKSLAEDRIRVDVEQRYESDTYKDISNKRFYLNQNAAGEWKIYREKSI